MTKRRAALLQATGRDVIQEDGRETLVMLQGCSQTVNVVLVALTDGVELEVWADGSLRRRARFLRDTEARKYSARLTNRLSRRGYRKAALPLRPASRQALRQGPDQMEGL
jgi:hypothetical protein